MPPKTSRKNNTERRGIKDLGAGLRWRTSWMPREIFEAMCMCDKCGKEGEIYGFSEEVRLYWNGRSLLCNRCK